MEVSLSKLLKHYKRPEIQKEILYNAVGREVAVKFMKGFGKRPDLLSYPQDVLQFAKRKATSFHLSEERWRNPLQISTGMSRKELDEIRKGWDLVLDIDCDILDISKVVAKYTVEFLKHNSINAVSCKFSGNHGFHIGVPFESFPTEVHGTPIEKLFPEAARKVAGYIWARIEDKISEHLLSVYGFEKLQELTGITFNKITKMKDGKRVLNPRSFVDIDTVLIASRHLYRSVYSFNEKSGLVSVPINPDKALEFRTLAAKPENVRVSKYRFLDVGMAREAEATSLFEAAFSYAFDEDEFDKEYYKAPLEEMKKFSSSKSMDVDELAEAIPEEYFPPCIKSILVGLEDGRKRALFVLTNFLSSVGWSHEDIEKRILQWNEDNPKTLREGDVKSHLKYHKQRKETVMPPNCDNEGYYPNIGVCKEDNLCRKVKNPVQYAKIKAKNASKDKKKSKKTSRKKSSGQGQQSQT
ncbi:MAG: DNA primase small subunit domain-containing protein [Nanobdellota archaeon]